MINLKKRLRKDKFSAPESFYILDCLLSTGQSENVNTTNVDSDEAPNPMTSNEITTVTTNCEVIPVRLDCVVGISAVRLMIPSDLRSKQARLSVLNAISKVHIKMGGILPPLDPIEDMHISNHKFLEINEVSLN